MLFLTLYKMDYKPIIIENLDILRKREVINKEPFKVRAYENVLNQLNKLEKPVYGWKDLEGITGIGKKIHAKIEEIFQTGKLESAQKTSVETLEIYDDFLKVYGIGPSKAKELVSLDIKTIPELRMAVKKNPLLLSYSSRVGLKHFEDFQERIPREEMKVHDAMIHLHLLPKMKAEIVGSYRRGALSSGDLDVLIQVPNLSYEKQVEKFQNYIDLLQDVKYITNILSLGERKCLAVCKIEEKYRRIDFLLTPPEEFPYAILYFTGSKEFNIAMRNYALEKGWSLSEHGMKRTSGEAINLSFIMKEKDIFDLLDLQYISPEQRIDSGMIRKK